MKTGASVSFAALVGALLAAAVTATVPGCGKAPAAPADPMPLPDAAPLRAIHAHFCGLHFYSGDLHRQTIAHHYCSQLNKDVWQCVLYDSDKAGARLIGVEYIVSGALFAKLPPEEKKLWHSHRYEVLSGQLFATGLSADAEKKLMAEFAGTYGKAWTTWQTDRDGQVPLGIPQLMMSFTADGQAGRALIDAHDKAGETSTAERKKDRAGIVAPAVQPGADAWRDGEAVQLQLAVRPGAAPATP